MPYKRCTITLPDRRQFQLTSFDGSSIFLDYSFEGSTFSVDDSMFIGGGNNHAEALQNAVTTLEAILEALQGPPQNWEEVK